MAKNKSRWVAINFSKILSQKIKNELNNPLAIEIWEAWRKLPPEQKSFRPYMCDGKVFFAERRKHYYRNMINLENE